MTVPATERRGRLNRLQKVSAVTSVAAVGVSALAFTAAPGQEQGSMRTTAAELPAEPAAQPAAWQAAADSTAVQKTSIDTQTTHADDRARDAARAEARRKAAKQAEERAEAARRAEAERAEEQAREARQEAARRAQENSASRSSARTGLTSATSGSPQAIARQILGDGAQFQCFSNIVERESGWNVHAQNPSGAYGLVQALPGSKMSSAGPDWRNSAATQIKWGLGYMQDRYGSPCGAWSFWQANNWY